MNNRLENFRSKVKRHRLDAALVANPANLRALTGLDCDAAVLLVPPARSNRRLLFYTDFRYVPMVHRLAPEMAVRDIRRLERDISGLSRIGYEASETHQRFLSLQKAAPKATFVDLLDDLSDLRSVKTADEIAALRTAVTLNDQIWTEAQARFQPGMTEREMANVIRHLMIDKGQGEAFATIVCVGRNAAECHHEPDETVWNGRECVLVDMGVRIGGVCSDMTRNLVPRASRLYRQVYDLVLKANLAAIEAARPGLTCKALDKVARDIIRKGGFGRCFGHSLGHGVGYEIHESPTVSRRSDTVLKPGMTVTIEPGIYLEDNLGVRIEDLVLITADGCEVLSHSSKTL